MKGAFGGIPLPPNELTCSFPLKIGACRIRAYSVFRYHYLPEIRWFMCELHSLDPNFRV